MNVEEMNENNCMKKEDYDSYKNNISNSTDPIKTEFITDNNTFYTRQYYQYKHKIGNGKMEYIDDLNMRELYVNAWKAITLTDSWDFIEKNVNSFAWSDKQKVYKIIEKMVELGYDIHSEHSFIKIMSQMRFLVQNGEEPFKNYLKTIGYVL